MNLANNIPVIDKDIDFLMNHRIFFRHEAAPAFEMGTDPETSAFYRRGGNFFEVIDRDGNAYKVSIRHFEEWAASLGLFEEMTVFDFVQLLSRMPDGKWGYGSMEEQ